MLKQRTIIFLLILTFVGSGYAVDKIELTNPIKFDRQLGKNNVFLKFCDFFDVEDTYFYFLDRHFSTIFKVEQETGKLVQTISSKGQGPQELQTPVNMRVVNHKIFILDSGFNGIKIFDTDGNFINEFRLDFVVGERNIDVNQKEEIFLGRPDQKNDTMISVYDAKGKKLRTLAPMKALKGVKRLNKAWYYTVRLDKDGSIYILFYLDRILAKYDKDGKLLWQSPIKNKLLDSYDKKDKVKGGKSGTINIKQRIFGIDITPGGNVIVAHAGGGSMFSPDGKLKNLLTTPGETWSLFEFKIFNNQLMNIAAFGQRVNIYQFKEEQK